MLLVDAQLNYVPLQRHPDPLSNTVNLGTGEVLYYSVDPTSEGIVPVNLTGTAICVQAQGTGPSFTWNVATQAWV